MKSVEERLREYEPLWENWTYTGEFLGEGAMSSVFEIESTAMGMREVAALKIITVQKNMYGEVKIPENALNEIKILRTLSSCPNIVHYHDSTQRKIYDENNQLSEIDILIKMEKLAPLNESKKLSEKEVIKLAKDMCNALSHASKHGIIHRDIKPQNMFVDSDGVYKLGDFGISKIVSDLSQYYTMNIGTMAYTAPEVRSGKMGVYDIAADIYSLGLSLYAFLNNGFLPFVANTSSLHDAIAKRLSGAPFPSPANGSKKFKAIVMRACNNDLAKRYKNPEEMLADLEMLSSGGKKLVVDPFATMDANIDVKDPMDTVYHDRTSYKEKVEEVSLGEGASGKKKSLIINMSKSPKSRSKDSVDDTATISVTPVRVKKEKLLKDTSDSPKTGGGLRVRMGKKKETLESSAGETKIDEKTEKVPLNETEKASTEKVKKDTEEIPSKSSTDEKGSFFSKTPSL